MAWPHFWPPFLDQSPLLPTHCGPILPHVTLSLPCRFVLVRIIFCPICLYLLIFASSVSNLAEIRNLGGMASFPAAILGPKLTCSGPFWPFLAASWPHLGPILAGSWPVLAHLAVCWRILAPSWHIFGPSWTHLGPIFHLGPLLAASRWVSFFCQSFVLSVPTFCSTCSCRRGGCRPPAPPRFRSGFWPSPCNCGGYFVSCGHSQSDNRHKMSPVRTVPRLCR